MNKQAVPSKADAAASLHELADAVEHAVKRDLVRPHEEAGLVTKQQLAGHYPAPSSLVLIVKNSNGQWDSLPL